MIDLVEKKKKANELRKTSHYKDALIIYKELWDESGDKFDGAGLLHCLRKLSLFNEAIPFSEELIGKYKNFNWCRNEVIWTTIQGKFNIIAKKERLEEALDIGNRIMELGPDVLASKLVVLKISKLAKDSKNWDILNEWIIKIDPSSLSSEPITNASGKKGWSDQSRWYYYRILGLINTGQTDNALILIADALERFPTQGKFFLRLKADIYCSLGDLDKAENIYEQICNAKRGDWWLLHRYSLLIMAKGRKKEALELMCQAASRNSKLDVMVNLFADIGELCKELGYNEEARAHFSLCKYIREQKGWPRSELLLVIDDLNRIIENIAEPKSLNESLIICRNYWNKLLDYDPVNKSREARKIRYNLSGFISLGAPNRPFCFINSNKESFFCYKSDLPIDIRDGERVKFIGVPSFDKKKNKESWKAINIDYY